MKLIKIGYWKSDDEPGWPDPHDLVDMNWDESERESVAAYLEDGMVARAYMGKSRCRFCGKLVGSLERTDLTFIWPEGLPHYLTTHGVRLPAEFVRHAASLTESMENPSIDDEWWVRTVRDSLEGKPDRSG